MDSAASPAPPPVPVDVPPLPDHREEDEEEEEEEVEEHPEAEEEMEEEENEEEEDEGESSKGQTAPAAAPHRQQPTPPGREDCWSEGATWSLIDAWGERYRQLSRGSLRQKDWQEVADAVTSRENYSKPPKTDSQCKNRIDTLKKKFKLESCKKGSSWPFLPRLRELLSPPAPPAVAPEIPAGESGSFRHQMQHLQLKRKRSTKKRSHRKILENLVPPRLPPAPPPPPGAAGGGGMGDLTRAISRIGEIYERVESRKMQQAVEMERQRMGLARELELQRMEFFMKTLVELTQLKRRP